jgi:imidazole glycerol-phosphate synthase subunit HisF
VKTTRFRKPRYIGDPINTVKLLNEKEADEISVIDIQAARGQRAIDFGFVEDVVSEAFVPVSYGGGVRALEDAEKLFDLGVEKVVINTGAHEDGSLVSQVAAAFGSQAVIGGVDYTTRFGRQVVVHSGATSRSKIDPVTWSRRLEELGAGEIVLTSVDREGTFSGYDLATITAVAEGIGVPLVANGGARGLDDLRAAVAHGADAAAAGSLFVYHGVHRAVLITYPQDQALFDLFEGVG